MDRTKIADYEILGTLGEGGMGIVYRARDATLDREIAIKVLRPAALAENAAERFIREAKACSRINHPNIVTVYAAGVDDGTPYLGFLYAGLMIAADGTPKVLEFNCRFGDPETQPILARMRSDLTVLCEAALDGRLDTTRVDWDPRAAVGVVLAAGGYPETVRKGDVIHGLDAAAKLPGKVFHAGTALADGRVVTNGGRVLCAVGLGTTVRAAQKQAYELAGAICWEGLQYRKDIGYRAIARE